MVKKYWLIDNATALFVFVMTFAVSFVVSAAQSSQVNLMGRALHIFVFGFAGSVICIIGRFLILYYKAGWQKSVIKKVFMLFYLALWSILFLLALGVTLQLSNFSLEYHSLSYYNEYQIFMLVILMAQWLGEKLFMEGN